jgi:hypothetical protein
MEHHHKNTMPKAAGEARDTSHEKSRKPRIRDYLLLVVMLGLPAPVVAVITPGQGEAVVLGVLLAYVLWVVVLARPAVRRIYRAYDAGICTREREIASWSCDRATLQEYKRGMKRRFPWTWRFRRYVYSRPGPGGYVQFRFYPEGVQIDGNLFRLARNPQWGRFMRTSIDRMEVLQEPLCIVFRIHTSSGRNSSSGRLFIPFPPESRDDVERVMNRIDRGNSFA